MQYVNLSDAEFVVDQASYSYGNGIFWFPSHQFNVVIPKLTITTPQVVQNYANTNVFSDGVGYFETVTINATPTVSHS